MDMTLNDFLTWFQPYVEMLKLKVSLPENESEIKAKLADGKAYAFKIYSKKSPFATVMVKNNSHGETEVTDIDCVTLYKTFHDSIKLYRDLPTFESDLKSLFTTLQQVPEAHASMLPFACDLYTLHVNGKEGYPAYTLVDSLRVATLTGYNYHFASTFYTLNIQPAEIKANLGLTISQLKELYNYTPVR
jgi:hypothetical protein